MRVVITGADGFVGKNLRAAFMERKDVEVLPITRASTAQDLDRAVAEADAVVHLAGVNRTQSESEFERGNAGFTRVVCDAVRRCRRQVGFVMASSAQAERDTPYGASKRAAEEPVLELQSAMACPLALYRLPNVFGKWARPNYNSVVATFCFNAVHGLPLTIHVATAEVRLVHIDDVVTDFVRRLDGDWPATGRAEVAPVYAVTVGQLAAMIQGFRDGRAMLTAGHVGRGLERALYSTYISYLPPEQFKYAVPAYSDARGVFVEMLKTPDSGQLSFFTAHPGVTRGGHYHHTKTEKFLVVRGQALFRFRHILSGETCEIHASGEDPAIVDTVPGWAHDITNVGQTEMIVMLWANEVYDRSCPDTYSHRV
jgi:UDP-2-acetamido-2,6-beta-L-arabino-hexul-4-ose reductase